MTVTIPGVFRQLGSASGAANVNSAAAAAALAAVAAATANPSQADPFSQVMAELKPILKVKR